MPNGKRITEQQVLAEVPGVDQPGTVADVAARVGCCEKTEVATRLRAEASRLAVEADCLEAEEGYR